MSVSTGQATVVKAVFNGSATGGPIDVPGLNVGDVMVQCIPAGFTGGFEAVVSVVDQLQQTSTLDWSPAQFTAYFLRGV
ncbi:hypothetical protein [Burkholderia pyrrocinia]|uniref:hypothetical protein n=1 Tax=Burkholderia pyrrocinia TaxID=60550 RepID=UPI00158864E5|nr:hypothetical protein [Burkholderia pyrrocinia]